MYSIDVYNTHIEVYPYKKDDLPVIEKMYTAIDKFSGDEFPCGYLINDGKLYLPRGTSISKLEDICNTKAKHIPESDPYTKMDREHESYFEPRDQIQKDSIDFLKGHEQQLALNLATGVGKGNPLSTKIPSPDDPRGYKLMGEIKPGDRIFGSKGNPITVTQIFPLGVQDIYRVTFNDGRVSDCTGEHLWNVFHKWSPNKVHTLTTLDILKDYKVYRPHMMDDCPNRKPWEYRYHVQLCNAVQYPHKDVPIHPYVIGALIGNGCLREQPLTISSGDDFVPKRISMLCGFEFEHNSKFNYNYIFRDPQHRFSGIRVSTKEFLNPYPELINKYSYEKEIPSDYLFNDVETRMELLRGLLDTDGCINCGDGRFNIIYSSCSSRLLQQIRWLVLSLGFISNISSPDKRVEKYTTGYHASVSIRVPNRLKHQFFHHPKKYEIAMNAVHQKDTKQKYSYIKIVNVEKVRREEAQCIMVDAPDHLYLTEDFVVTHNTFVVAYTSAVVLNIKALIITPNDSLKRQWMVNTFQKMIGLRESELCNISGSAVMNAIMNDQVEPANVYFVNHQTLHSFLMQNNPYIFQQFFKKINVGIKVYDESHMDFANILLVDFFSNTNRTWYLTATFDRSDKTESVCFKRAFQSVIAYGEYESKAIRRKHVIYHVVNIYSKITAQARAQLMGYPAFTAAKYGKYAIFDDKSNSVYNTILTILEKTKDMEGKTLIFVPLIDGVDEVVSRLKRDFPYKSVAAYHSKISKEEKESAEKKDIIVSTIKSCGTGKDIKGLRSIICAEPIASKVVTEQMIGRLRPYADDKDTYYWDIVDRAIPALNWWYKSRMKKIQELAKQIVQLNLM